MAYSHKTRIQTDRKYFWQGFSHLSVSKHLTIIVKKQWGSVHTDTDNWDAILVF